MGVHGLWQLLQSTGKPVSLESLEGKKLAVDVSIWLHQVTKGLRDKDGNPVANAHLQGLFSRVCKLLYYRVKPVFVFDGGVPQLKKQTIARRWEMKDAAKEEADKTSKKLLHNLMQSHAVKQVLGTAMPNTQTAPPKHDMFELPPLPEPDKEVSHSLNYEDEELSEDISHYHQLIEAEFQSFDDIDVESEDFRSLPSEIRHEILTEMKEVRKQQYTRTSELPQQADDFSSFQMAKIIKQSKLTAHLVAVREEMKSRSCADVYGLLGEESSASHIQTQRIASEDTSHYILLKGISRKKQLEEASKCQVIAEENIYDVIEKQLDRSSDLEVRITTASVDDKIINSVDAKINPEKIQDKTNPERIHDKTDETLHIKTKLKTVHAETKDVCGKETEDATDCLVIEKRRDEEKTRNLSEDPQNRGDCDFNVSHYEKQFQEILQADIQSCSKNVSRNVSDATENDVQEILQSKMQRCSKNINTSVSDTTENYIQEISQVDVQSCGKNLNRNVSDATENDIQEISQVDVQICSKNVNTSVSKTIEHDVCLLDGDKLSVGAEDRLVLNDKQLREKINLVTESDNSDSGHSKNRLQLTVDSSSDSDDENFIEVEETVSPQKADVIFPASVFETDQTMTSNKIQVESDDSSEKEMANNENKESPQTESSHSVVIDTEQSEKDQSEQPRINLTRDELEDIQDKLDVEGGTLRSELGRQERLATSITEQMNIDAQELLQLFGIPYVVSPMEAEAQCAQLNSDDMADGIITDDSDVWLFGGRQVYKNFFNHNKHVELYTNNKIETQLGMTREQLINIAYLCGSDYTVGIPGVGPVTALEILAEFPGVGSSALLDFKKWWDENHAVKKQTVTSKIKSKLRDLNLEPGFPNLAVAEAYLNPAVDHSTETFTWGVPDLDLLRKFATERMGWSQQKTDSLILPVMKQLNNKQNQAKISSYFQPENFIEVPRIASQRMKRALNKINQSTDTKLSTNEIRMKKAKVVVARDQKDKRKGNVRGKRGRTSGKDKVKAKVERKVMDEVALSDCSSSEGETSEGDKVKVGKGEMDKISDYQGQSKVKVQGQQSSKSVRNEMKVGKGEANNKSGQSKVRGQGKQGSTTVRDEMKVKVGGTDKNSGQVMEKVSDKFPSSGGFFLDVEEDSSEGQTTKKQVCRKLGKGKGQGKNRKVVDSSLRNISVQTRSDSD